MEKDAKTDEAVKRMRHMFSIEHVALAGHLPAGEERTRRQALLDGLEAGALAVLRYTAPGREQALALTKLEEALHWARAALIRE